MSRNIISLVVVLLFVFAGQTFAQEGQGNGGQYERIRVAGVSLEGNLSGDDSTRDVSIYLPPSYSNNPDKHYPVLYLLHGFTDSDANWFGLNGDHFVNVPQAMDAAWENGAVELIVVMPNALNRFWGSMYSNSVTIGDWESYVAKDLVAYIDGHYRTLPEKASRGLAGHSMGGYGALRIAMKHPEVFGSLYAMSPCCMAPSMHPDSSAISAVEAITNDDEIAAADFGLKAMLASAASWSPNPQNPPLYIDLPIQNGEVVDRVVAMWAANAPLTMVHQYMPALKQFDAIYVDAGDRDVGINETVHTLDDIFNDYGIVHVAEEYEGDHVNRIHERLIQKVMPMFSQYLKTE